MASYFRKLSIASPRTEPVSLQRSSSDVAQDGNSFNGPVRKQSSKRLQLHGLLCGALFAVVSLAGCGGGGGGDDFIGAALTAVRVSPSTIDTGDRMLVVSDLAEVNNDGILLKYRYPAGLEYVLDSARLIPSGDDRGIEVDPSFNGQQDGLTYLVFFLRGTQFGGSQAGRVEFQLKGIDRIQDGRVEIDADVNDPLIDDATEFDVESPEFGAEDSAGVVVTP